MKENNKNVKQCIFKNCQKNSYGGARGLCANHYAGWYFRVKRGDKTWEQLEAEGLVLPKLSQAEKNTNQMHGHISHKK